MDSASAFGAEGSGFESQADRSIEFFLQKFQTFWFLFSQFTMQASGQKYDSSYQPTFTAPAIAAVCYVLMTNNMEGCQPWHSPDHEFARNMVVHFISHLIGQVL